MPFKSTNLLLSCWQTGLLERGCLLPSLQKAAQQDKNDSHGGRGGMVVGWPGLLQRFQFPLKGVRTHFSSGIQEKPCG